MRIQTRLAAVCTAAALFTLPAIATAQPAQPGTPSLSDRETARNLMDDGDKKRDSGDLKGALASYEKADALMKVPTTGIEVAKAQIALGLFLEARETLNRVSKSTPKPGEPTPFTAARKQAETLNAELAPRIPSVVVVPANTEPGQPATISVDGEEIPPAVATVPRKINPGPHVAVVKSGSLEKKVEFTVAEKENKTLNVDLKDQPKPPPPPPPPEKPKPSGMSTGKLLMFGGFGLAAVGIGVGSVTGIMSISKTSEIKDKHCKDDKCTPDQASEIDSAKTLGNVSTIAFIAGGVGAGIGVVGLLLMSKESKEGPADPPPAAAFKPVDVHAVLGPSYAGISGRF
ncbi:MAG: hypothetical protein U0270_25960 [Labilithrix sp.]